MGLFPGYRVWIGAVFGGVVRKWERGRKQGGSFEMRQGKFPDKVVLLWLYSQFA